MDNKKTLSYNVIGGVLFALIALVYAFELFSFGVIWSFPYHILITAGCVVTAVALFGKMRNIVPVIGLGLFALSRIYIFGFFRIRYISIYFYSIYDFINFLANIFYTVGYIGIFLFALAAFTNCLPKLRETAKKLWFVPALCVAIAAISDFIHYIRYIGYYIDRGWILHFNILNNLIIPAAMAAAFFLVSMWMFYPDGMHQKYTAESGAGASNTVAVPSESCYIEIMMHVLLLIFTCGIWQLIWIYRTTDYLNCVEGEEHRDPVTKLLLCIFIPFYLIYWTYKSAQRIDKLAQSKGVQSDLSMLCLILAIFVGIIPPILMQDKLNAIAMAKGFAQAAQTAAQPEISAQPVDVPEELKKYKELLDNGVITQEDYDAKKKQLLGL